MAEQNDEVVVGAEHTFIPTCSYGARPNVRCSVIGIIAELRPASGQPVRYLDIARISGLGDVESAKKCRTSVPDQSQPATSDLIGAVPTLCAM